MSGIFICYRREDSGGYAGRLYDHLIAYFPGQTVFMDVDGIPPGVDFVDFLNERLSTCDVLIAVMGKAWIRIRNESGMSRLDDPEDFVRIELQTALERKVPVIPLLVGGATMPQSKDLPAVLSKLVRRQSFQISDTSFATDVARLVEALGQTVGPNARYSTAKTQNQMSPGRTGNKRGNDLRYDIVVALEDAIAGNNVDIEFERKESCPECEGGRRKCSNCKGKGKLSYRGFFMAFDRDCDKCGGRRIVGKSECAACESQGYISCKRRLKVNIPPGVKNGNRIRLAGEGDWGQPSGDLYVFVNIPETSLPRAGG